MTDQGILARKQIETALKSFSTGNLSQNTLSLFTVLGYNTLRQNPFVQKTSSEFEENFGHVFAEKKFNKDKARFDEWKSIDLLFQLSKDELFLQPDLFDTRKVRWEGEDKETVIETYLFFAIELAGFEYSRTALAQITREVNKVFPMPVMVVFRHDNSLTVSIINRRLHKKNEQKDVLEKVTLIKDVSIANPHRAHIEILFDLSYPELLHAHKFTNFVELHNAWQKTLDTKELNKRFYAELSNWYFWAMDHVSFPDDMEKNKEIRNATSLIRLITRIIFVWFIKEKNLVPEALFDRRIMQNILKVFNKDRKANSYYRAILQNLFFGTLNQRMNERGFAKDGTFLENKSNYGVKNLFRYAGDFAVDEKEVLALFQDIPFLNGGLFDCLDKENDQDKVIYSDGFSRNTKKQADVPDFLFFGAEEDYDLNATYGTKNKRYKVKGLFNIFSAYKFTVAENTPVEEEIALDPELLGRVFENLLASYNPETKTTARKQTGSFYTPREIVNYMVDESLKAYLKQNLEANAAMPPEDADAGLEILFSYTEKEHAFNGSETKTLINAVDNCKILDPACGSGAFPMGVLHKLVHVLHKLDPQNAGWKERQISKARFIDDPVIREQTIADIEAAFAGNELDYGRKLYLIENCIYGVDIQPIAVQIAKLRFFISLVVDQKKNSGRKNLGILSLPNLETKFVAANTLIGLDKPQTGGQVSIKDPEVENLEDDLKALRHQYFTARTRREKLACQKKDRELRKKISSLLEKDGWNKDSASQVAAFDPYDQNASSPFFDPEWMFGITDGFDVVIGNPPYIQIQNFSGSQQQKDWEQQQYSTYVKTGDVYCLFYERGYQLLRNGGTLTYITSNKWMRAKYGKSLRSYFAENTNPLKLIDFENFSVFEATVNTNILMLAKGENEHNIQAVSVKGDFEETTKISDYLAINGVVLKNLNEDSWLITSNAAFNVKAKIEKVGIPLKDWDISIYRGILTGLNEAFIINGETKEKIITKERKSAEIIKPILLGKNIKRYRIEYNDLWLLNTHNGYTDKTGTEINRINVKKDYPAIWEYFNKVNRELDGRAETRYDQGAHWTNLRNCAYVDLFNMPKIAWGNLAISSQFAYVASGVFINAPSPLITPGNKYLLAVLNSKLGDYYIRSLGVTRNGGYFEYKPMFVERLPVPKISSETQPLFENLVDYICFCQDCDMSSESIFLETVIDGLVYELYLPDEIKAADAEVLKHLTTPLIPLLRKEGSSKSVVVLSELKDEWPDEKKLEVIENVYKELSDPSHPVSIAMARQKTVPEVRIIEGLDKE